MLTNNRPLVVFVALGLLATVGVVVLFAYFRAPPQMGADAEVFRTVDALFTAVTAQDEKLLDQCEQRLRACHEAGKLPPAAWSRLDGVIQTARAGRWRPAAETLYDFMKGQRREGSHDDGGGKKKRANSNPGTTNPAPRG